ncbi:MAG: serine/threonine-protein phosphatase [Holosporales bacterium]|jgi:sigma-B regulation protein RsbU (phosphoserine phosphatase)|nr:serine/threonine-protein phosphatase [Holosporales bacterium]
MDVLGINSEATNKALRRLVAIEKEIDISAEIQASLLPGDSFRSKNVSLYAYIKPAARVSGDFYDFFLLDKYRLAVLIADVSGKNVSASLLASMTKGLFRAYAKIYIDPAVCVGKVNDCLIETNKSLMFVTSVFGVMDIRSGVFEYVNAGHLLPILINDRKTESLDQGEADLALGIDKEINFTKNKIAFNGFDKILLYTDGVTEAMNARNTEFGADNLLEVCSSKRLLRPKALTRLVVKALGSFVGNADQSDDITVICLQYKKGRENDKNDKD